MNQFEMKQSAYQSQLKSRALQILLYLIDRSNKEQTCFPAVPTIGRELHISISTVKRAMRELVEAGYVTKESRFREGNRGQTSNLYTLHFPEKENINMPEGIVALEKLVQNEQQEQIGAESACMTEEYVEPQCGEQNIGKVTCISTAKHIDDKNELDTVSENELGRMELINYYMCKENSTKAVTSVVIGQEGIQGYLDRENIRIIRSILRKGRSINLCTFQWPGEGVNLIPP